MKIEDLTDAKVGSRQVTAIYLGSTLLWPASATTYVITGAQLHFSVGSRLDAGAVGSDYTGNYAWVTGTVVVYSGDTPVETLQNVMLTPTVSNTTDFLVQDTYYIYGHNLGVTATYAYKTTYVDVTYLSSRAFTVGSQVEQVLNIETTSYGTPYIVDGTPFTYIDTVPDSHWVTMRISRYGTSQNPCPAYGSTTTVDCVGGHTTAYYSQTPWDEYTPVIHSFSSGSSYTVDVLTDEGYYPPVELGGRTEVDDNLSENVELTYSTSGGSGWATYNYANDLLTIANAGSTVYESTRYVTLTATNETASASVTAYQHSNTLDTTTITYDLYCQIVRSTPFPAAGGTFPVNYHARKTVTEEYTSGSTSVSTLGVECRVETTPSDIASVSEVTGPSSGNGTFNLNVPANGGAQAYIAVYITAKEDISKSANDSRMQDAGTFPQGQIYPYVSPFPQVVSPTQTYPAGRIQIHWLWTSGTTPTPSYPLTATFTNLTLHWVFEGSQQEYSSAYQGQIEATFSGNDVNFYPVGKFTPMLEGSKGRCWFTADGVTNISVTYPTDKTFEVPDSTPPLSM